jgi:glycosyltransferase involved in cell wall biosynthesis
MSYAPIFSEPTLTDPEFTKSLNSEAFNSRTTTNSKKRTRSAGRRPKSARQTIQPQNSNAKEFPIIVHCHLCWDWVWQRPQQFISRLAKRHNILFIETLPPDSSLAAPLARFKKLDHLPNLTILSIQFPLWRWNDGAYVDSERRRLVLDFINGPAAGQFENPVQWFYDPMAITAFSEQLGEIATVYDCMDELSKFRGAPPQILEREAELLKKADVVFTGGRTLWDSKSKSNQNCHFYGCGVDSAHFGRAREVATEIPTELIGLKRPILGFFGVVDERMDYELLSKLADANPAWSVAVVGPVLKVDPNSLPKRSNLYWLGQRAYSELPAFCKGFDLCLMPFALNESTEFINPTKALEYMATGRMIISSAVPDVVRNFGSVVKIAANHEEFIALCKRSLAEPDQDAINRGLEMAAGNSWESIVAKMENHIEQFLSQNTGSAVAA